jgi:hypothetical protein
VGTVAALAPGCALVSFCGPLLPGNCPVAYDHFTQDVTAYPWRQTAVTPKGVRVDGHDHLGEHGSPEFLAAIDAHVDAVEACRGRRIHRCAIRVQVAPDSRLAPPSASGDGGQVFPCRVPSGFCHGAVQHPATAVVTPDLSALRHELEHIVSGEPDGSGRCG